MTNDKYIPASDDQLAAEAEYWSKTTQLPDGWIDAPEAVPRRADAKSVTILMPTRMLDILEAFAERDGVRCQVLINRWLDERIREERDKLSVSTGADHPPSPSQPD